MTLATLAPTDALDVVPPWSALVAAGLLLALVALDRLAPLAAVFAAPSC